MLSVASPPHHRHLPQPACCPCQPATTLHLPDPALFWFAMLSSDPSGPPSPHAHHPLTNGTNDTNGVVAADAPVAAATAATAASDVAQALETARESPTGADDPAVSRILESALAALWARVQAQPDSYVMTRDEFAVFTFYQDRFGRNDRVAVDARRRYWDSMGA